MSLLPKTVTDFASSSFWDEFFSKRKSSFEWYGNYGDLCALLHKYSKPTSRVLVAGCGNSALPEDLYDVGYRDVHSVDISDVVIRQMSERNKAERPELVFEKMDLLQMTYDDAAFDLVLDKGTCDALCTDASPETRERMKKMFAEVARVMKVGGRYLCVSLAQDHVLECLMDNFKEGWLVRVHVVAIEISEEVGLGGELPVFVFVMTKMATIPGKPAVKVFEVAEANDKVTRLNTAKDITETVKSLQQFAMIRHHFRRLHPGEVVSVDLWDPAVAVEPRYTLHVVDVAHKLAKSGPFALFIVPHGRESDWLFVADAGLQQLATSAGFQRVVVVTLHRLHSYGSLDDVKSEIADTAVQFAQSNAQGRESRKWPVLSLGDDLGQRTVRHQGYSEHSGQFVVEDVQDRRTGVRTRRLVFLSAPQLTQSEVKLVKGKKGKSLIPDPKSLASEHHMVFVSCLGFLATKSISPSNPLKVLVVGLGGGSLPRFIDQHLSNVHIDVVELDGAMVEVARHWFGFESHGSLVAYTADGIGFVEAAAKKGEKWDVVCVDVDNKDHRSGISSPPMEFVSKTFLDNVKAATTENGFCVMNLTARNKAKREEIVSAIRVSFGTILVCKLEEDINEVLLLCNHPKRLLAMEDKVLPKERAERAAEGLVKYLARDIEHAECLTGKTVSEHLQRFAKV